MRSITISKRFLITILCLIGLAVAVPYTFRFVGSIIPQPTPTVSPDRSQAAEAVVIGAEAFFQVDYQEGMDAWLGRFCSVSSKAGCVFARSGSRSLWDRYEAVKTVTTAKVTPQTLIRETADEQVWQVSIQLSKPLPGSEKTQEAAYAIAVREDGVWKFDRFLMPQEIDAIQQTAGGEK